MKGTGRARDRCRNVPDVQQQPLFQQARVLRRINSLVCKARSNAAVIAVLPIVVSGLVINSDLLFIAECTQWM